MCSSLPSLNPDSKPTVETLGPTAKNEETTTPYPIDEEATECGENCSFEDGEEGGGYHTTPGMAGCGPGTVGQRSRGLREGIRGVQTLGGLGQRFLTAHTDAIRYYDSQNPHRYD